MKPYYQDDLITLYCGDAAKIIPQLKRHSLLLTDPPYGQNTKNYGGPSKLAKVNEIYRQDRFEWDVISPQWLIDESIAKCSYAIIFGGNYYRLSPTSCWLIWDKQNGETDFADCEIAWTNLPKAVRRIKHTWNGMIRIGGEEKYHPSQKPLRVIKWMMNQVRLYPFHSSILDPFAGSGTTLIAAKMQNFKSTGIEIRQEYCDLIIKRIKLKENTWYSKK